MLKTKKTKKKMVGANSENLKVSLNLLETYSQRKEYVMENKDGSVKIVLDELNCQNNIYVNDKTS